MQSGTRDHYRILLAVFLPVAMYSALGDRALAQNTGFPVVENSTMMTASQGYLDATMFTTTTGPGTACSANSINNTSDTAAMIQQAICALPATGGTVDARGFANQTAFPPPITFQSNPFADPHTANGTVTTTKNVVLLLPAATIQVSAVIGIPRQSLLKGQGSLATILQVVNGFPGFNSSTNSEPMGNCGKYQSGSGGPRCFPVICMGLNGDSTSSNYTPLISTSMGNSCENPTSVNPSDGHAVNNPRVQVESLGIDLNPSTGSGTAYGVAIQNITAQEKSWVRNVQIADIGNGGRGINIAATGQQTNIGPNEAQNSGPYTDLEINWAAPDCTITYFPNLTYGIFVSNGPSVTIGSGATSPSMVICLQARRALAHRRRQTSLRWTPAERA